MVYSKQGSEKMNKKTNQNQNEHGWDGNVHPEIEAIDHDANLEPMEQLMNIFSAYNHQHRKDGTAWKVWPDWELVLTSMNDALHFEDAERDTPEICTERQHWLSFMEFIHTSDAITIDGYTAIIEGKYGHQFTFDICLEYEYWVSPRSLVEHYQKTNAARTGQLGPPWKRNTLLFFSRHEIEHSLEAYWQCPEHVPNFGGQWTRYTHGNRFCIERQEGETFPLALQTLMQLCIDDTDIWRMMFEQDLADIEHHEFMEREWPGGRPDQDWEYQ
jgi:hypothetical protein